MVAAAYQSSAILSPSLIMIVTYALVGSYVRGPIGGCTSLELGTSGTPGCTTPSLFKKLRFSDWSEASVMRLCKVVHSSSSSGLGSRVWLYLPKLEST